MAAVATRLLLGEFLTSGFICAVTHDPTLHAQNAFEASVNCSHEPGCITAIVASARQLSVSTRVL